MDLKPTNWLEVDLVQQTVSSARAALCSCIGEVYEREVSEALAASAPLPVHSPLEAAFVCWWHVVLHIRRSRPIYLRPQLQVVACGNNYRLDFALEPPERVMQLGVTAGRPWQPMCVELDGHSFHEKTKEQVAKRNIRDRDLQEAGWKVFHFSFDEISKRGADSALEVYRKAAAQVEQIKQACVSGGHFFDNDWR